MDEKNFISLYTEHIHFLVIRAGWLVTIIYQHFTFEQAKFKKDFVVMNQKSRQKATSSVERSFYKLLSNANFGIDCRNNIENCQNLFMMKLMKLPISNNLIVYLTTENIVIFLI